MEPGVLWRSQSRPKPGLVTSVGGGLPEDKMRPWSWGRLSFCVLGKAPRVFHVLIKWFMPSHNCTPRTEPPWRMNTDRNGLVLGFLVRRKRQGSFIKGIGWVDWMFIHPTKVGFYFRDSNLLVEDKCVYTHHPPVYPNMHLRTWTTAKPRLSFI